MITVELERQSRRISAANLNLKSCKVLTELIINQYQANPLSKSCIAVIKFKFGNSEYISGVGQDLVEFPEKETRSKFRNFPFEYPGESGKEIGVG
jgi:hypothetical protein